MNYKEIIESSNKKEYFYSNETGDATLTVYTIFSGIQVVYNSVHTDCFDLSIPTKEGNFIEIHHCQEGRMEQEVGNDFFYLMHGDLSIAKRNQMVQAYHFPLQHYHGITIAIDTDIVPKCFSIFMEDIKIQPFEIVKRLCGERNCVILRSEPYIGHIFSEIYTMKEEQRIGYLKIKILELLFILNMVEPPTSNLFENTLPRIQVNLAKEVATYLTQNMDRRVTISELAKYFAVSETFLKNAFKGVYGVSIFSYNRIQKMQCAAQELIKTDRSIAEIASEYGYQNESKFSAAFKDVIGDTPSVWRKIHSKINII